MVKLNVLPGYVGNDLIEKILSVAEKNEYIPGMVIDENNPNQKHIDSRRVCELADISIAENPWLSSFLMHIANTANLDYGFELYYPRTATVTRYREGGHYIWHHDVEWRVRPSQRKLSISIQLSDGSDYEGGDLEFKSVSMSEEEKKILRTKGTLILFPSYLTHRVTPVISGERKTLVSWIEGPSWR